MIQEAYCSFEVSKLLKEKGFEGECGKCYMSDGTRINLIGFTKSSNDVILAGEEGYLAPTHQMACAWLREKHGLHIMVDCKGSKNYNPIIQSFDGKDFEVEGKVVTTTKIVNGNLIDVRRGFVKPEEAIDAAIKYSLENLI